jgi:uncharacterized protein YkwD
MRSACRGLLLFLGGAVLLFACPASSVASSESGRIVAKINAARSANGLAPLQRSAALTRSSQRYAGHLMASQWFGHAPAIQASGRFRRLGEVLAMHGGRGLKAAATVRGWMASPGHRSLILSPGFGYAGGATGKGMFSGRRAVIWVVQLGSM